MFCYMPQSMISLMKGQFVVTHKIRQTEIPALLDIWVTTHSFCQNFVSTRKLLLLIFSDNMLQCWSVDDLSSFSVSCKSYVGGLRQIVVL